MQKENKYKILAVSDSHNDKDTLERIIKKEADADMIIHLGDGLNEFEDIILNSKTNNYCVAGNCDTDSVVPYTRIINAAGKRFFIAHGHTFDVKETYSKIINATKSENVHICLFGHTHIQHKSVVDDMIILNPGAVSYFKEYALIEINNGNIEIALKSI